MNEITDSLNDFLDIPSISTDTPLVHEPDVVNLSDTDTLTSDFNIAKNNIRNMITKGTETLESLLEIAQTEGSPRHFEVAAQLIKNIGELSDRLLLTHKQNEDVNTSKLQKNPNTDANVNMINIFTGTTNQLQDALEAMSKKELKLDSLLNDK